MYNRIIVVGRAYALPTFFIGGIYMEKFAAVELFKRVQYVLDSDMTDYAIMKSIGDQSPNYIARLRNGKSKITDMRIDKASKFEYIYFQLKGDKK